MDIAIHTHKEEKNNNHNNVDTAFIRMPYPTQLPYTVDIHDLVVTATVGD